MPTLTYEADPHRCQYILRHGQCRYKAVEGRKVCEIHSSAITERSDIKNENNMYQLNQWQNRLKDLAEHDKVKSLRDEIGILRMVLEATLNRCETQTDLTIYSGKIADLVTRLEKLVVSCNKLEEKGGLLIDKAAIIQIASTLIGIVIKNVTDPAIANIIAEEFMEAIK